MTTYLNSLDQKQDLIERALKNLGYDLIDRGKYWQCNAVYRDGDNKSALQI